MDAQDRKVNEIMLKIRQLTKKGTLEGNLL